MAQLAASASASPPFRHPPLHLQVEPRQPSRYLPPPASRGCHHSHTRSRSHPSQRMVQIGGLRSRTLLQPSPPPSHLHSHLHSLLHSVAWAGARLRPGVAVSLAAAGLQASQRRAHSAGASPGAPIQESAGDRSPLSRRRQGRRETPDHTGSIIIHKLRAKVSEGSRSISM